MARRAKPAAEPVVSLAPPPSPHPPGGYDARTVAEAAEIIRHQTHVLEVRARIATAAGGVRPLHSEPPAILPVARLGLEAREAELAVATAALRDAEDTIARMREELGAREAAVAEREAGVLEQKQRLADAAVELDRDRRMLGVREEELAARDAAQRTETAEARMHEHGLEAARAGLEATGRTLADRESAVAEAEAALVVGRQRSEAALARAQARLDEATATEHENDELRAQLRAELDEVALHAGELGAREKAVAAAVSA